VDGEVVLVGHSYGGVVIPEAGAHHQSLKPRLHYGVCSRQGGVRRLSHRKPSARRSCPANPASQRRLSFPGPDKIRRFLRRGPGSGHGLVHGRFSSPVGG
jgi:hypothetical protein